ncbi:MAG: biotin-dependent carboxyltransferase family protein [Chloroflexi bacterium]|nr:biotin-dependent carboxyltransferase family protein [Chloroflexota bacterium]
MTNSVLRIESPGLMSTIQDLGRFGYQRYGISTSGAGDRDSLRLGNLLLGNEFGDAAVEITFGGFAAGFTATTAFVISGADLNPTLNGTPVALNTIYLAAKDDHIAMSAPNTGFRSYMHLPGGVDCDEVLGSYSTYRPARIGGIDGRALRVGDELSALEPGRDVPSGVTLNFPASESIQSPQSVRVVMGPQDDHFTAAGVQTLLGEVFTVTDRSSRQGVRLDGPDIEAVNDSYDIVSDAVVTGSIQIPGDRKPIILMSDRQTTGGYPKIAVIATVDLPLIAQSAPGAQIQFTAIDREEAVALLRKRESLITSATLISSDVREFELLVDSDLHRVHAPLLAGEQSMERFQIELDGIRHTVAIEDIE